MGVCFSASFAHRHCDPVQLLPASRRDHHPCAAPRELYGGGRADATGGARDQYARSGDSHGRHSME
jgi:hypothetical protein